MRLVSLPSDFASSASYRAFKQRPVQPGVSDAGRLPLLLPLSGADDTMRAQSWNGFFRND